MIRCARLIEISLGMAHLLLSIVMLPVALVLNVFSIPVVFPGIVWLVILGIRLIRGYRPIRGALRLTHSLLAIVSIELVVYGFYCLDAGRRSAEMGGGILSSFGLIPITIGVFAGLISILSLLLARSDAQMKIWRP